MIDAAESRGFTDALVNIGGGIEVRDESFRNSQRNIHDSIEGATLLFSRVEQFLPSAWHELGIDGGRPLVG